MQLVNSIRNQHIYKETEQKQQAIIDSIKSQRAPASGVLHVILRFPLLLYNFQRI